MRFEVVCQEGHQQMTAAEGEELAKLRCEKCGATMMAGVATPLSDAPFEHLTDGAAWWSESIGSLVATMAWATELAACNSWERALTALYELWEIQAVVDVLVGLVPYEVRRKLAPNKTVKTWEMLRVDMDQNQLAGTARQMARIAREIDDVEAEKKEANAEFKARLEELTGRLSEIGRGVREGQCVRTEVAIVFDYRSGQVTRYRTDTTEVLSERPMTGEERDEHRQEQMFDAESGRKKPKKNTSKGTADDAPKASGADDGAQPTA